MKNNGIGDIFIFLEKNCWVELCLYLFFMEHCMYRVNIDCKIRCVDNKETDQLITCASIINFNYGTECGLIYDGYIFEQVIIGSVCVELCTSKIKISSALYRKELNYITGKSTKTHLSFSFRKKTSIFFRLIRTAFSIR